MQLSGGSIAIDDLGDAVLELILAAVCATPGGYRHSPALPLVCRRWQAVYSQVREGLLCLKAHALSSMQHMPAAALLLGLCRSIATCQAAWGQRRSAQCAPTCRRASRLPTAHAHPARALQSTVLWQEVRLDWDACRAQAAGTACTWAARWLGRRLPICRRLLLSGCPDCEAAAAQPLALVRCCEDD